VILPVAWDEAGGTATYWAVAGVKVLRMHASYPEGYEPHVIESGYCSVKGFIVFEPYMLVEQTLEVTRPVGAALLSRDEFRALADRYSTPEELRAAQEDESGACTAADLDLLVRRDRLLLVRVAANGAHHTSRDRASPMRGVGSGQRAHG
jgi:hypothetical protein